MAIGTRRLETLWRVVAATCLTIAAFSFCAALKVNHDYASLPAPPRISDLSLSTVVLDREDRLLRAFTSADDKWRLPVTPKNIDPLYFELLLAFEDKRFFEHDGVDIWALGRAVLQSVRAGKLVSGGSTLTMQVARLLDEQPTKTVKRKYEQFLKAVRLEKTFTKDEILQLYVLRAPFGGNLEGVRAASLVWFGKEPRRLTPAEAALLVALPQSPELRRPDRSPKNAFVARNRVLARAQAAGVLSRETAESAAAEPIRTERHAMPFLAAHESRHARSKSPGKKVHQLTLDRDLQASLEALARRKVATFASPVSLAIVVADHEQQEILASIGAPSLLDTHRQGHVDMTRAVRSPGSTLKPFIYGLAFEERIGLPESLIVDRPMTIAGYSPTNFDLAYQGTVSLREALQLSLNTPAVRLLEAVGPTKLLARLKRTGVRPVFGKKSAPGLAIGLGGLGVTLKDLTQAYASLARAGQPATLQIYRNKENHNSSARSQPVLDRASAVMVGEVLQGLPQAKGSQSVPLAYKTGTSYGYRDAWAVGFDGRYVVAIWVGRPDGSPVPGQTGAEAAVPILFEVFEKTGPRREPLIGYANRLAGSAPAHLPQPLQFARLPRKGSSQKEPDQLRISFPPDGSELDLGLMPGEENGAASQPLVVKFNGGTGPYTILVNGSPHARLQKKRQVVWQPESAGFADVTVLDATGDSAGISVQLR